MPSSRYVRHVCLDDAVTTGVGTPHALVKRPLGWDAGVEDSAVLVFI